MKTNKQHLVILMLLVIPTTLTIVTTMTIQSVNAIISDYCTQSHTIEYCISKDFTNTLNGILNGGIAGLGQTNNK